MHQNDATRLTPRLACRLNDNRYTYPVDTLGKPVPAASNLWHPGYIVWDAVSLVPIQSAKSRDEPGIDVKLRRGMYIEREDKQSDATWQRIDVHLAFARRKKRKREKKLSFKNCKCKVIPVSGIDPVSTRNLLWPFLTKRILN